MIKINKINEWFDPDDWGGNMDPDEFDQFAIDDVRDEISTLLNYSGNLAPFSLAESLIIIINWLGQVSNTVVNLRVNEIEKWIDKNPRLFKMFIEEFQGIYKNYPSYSEFEQYGADELAELIIDYMG